MTPRRELIFELYGGEPFVMPENPTAFLKSLMNYDHWKTTNPDDEFLGNAEQSETNTYRREHQDQIDALVAQTVELETLNTKLLAALKEYVASDGWHDELTERSKALIAKAENP
jgi:hypothetical protein